ncbi:choice-of-anchor D domain-containing protein [Kribbella sp. NPDC051718]|uniref:choice-of-anchor D domain-containing protein n=1 Tax=Kribbella sp. NPDC051718 TaxID=3155168 RepID=UPI003439C6D2
MSEPRFENDANEGESERKPEALQALQSDRRGRIDNRRWRYAVRDVGALSYSGPGRWKQVGPAPLLIGNEQIFLGTGPDSGEVVDIAIDPRPGPDKVIYIATGNGGVWKSRDDGVSWSPLTDHLAAMAIGAIALDPVDPDILYVGTGNLFEGAGGLPKSAGLFKSVDGGVSWSRLTSPAGRPPQAITAAVNNGGGVRVTIAGHGYSTGDRVAAVGLPGVVGAVGEGDSTRIDANTLRIPGATMNAAYGGAGATLFDARQPPFLSDRGIIRMVCPTGGTLLVASQAGLYYSADGGRNFGANHPAYDDGRPIRLGVISALEVDQGWYRTTRVTGASNADPIEVTALRHGFATGDRVILGGVGPNQQANGSWLIDRVDADKFTLRTSHGAGGGATSGFAWGPSHPSTKPVTGATNPAAPNPIVITAAAHGFITGDIVAVSGVQGNTAANRSWSIRVLTPNTFSLVGSRGNGAYVAATGIVDGPQHAPAVPITAAANGGGGINVTVVGHGFDGDLVTVLGLPGINAPNNSGRAIRVDNDHFRIAGITMNAAYGGVGATVVGPADAFNTVYFASGGRTFRTTSTNPDRGLFRLTITSTGELMQSDNLLAHGGGVPAGLGFGRVVFAQSLLPRTRTLYASVQDNEFIGSSTFVGLFRSDDFGATWAPRPALNARAAADGVANIVYNLTLGVDPQHPQVVYAGFQQLWRSIDSGGTFPAVTPATRGGMDAIAGFGSSPSTTLAHWDHHELTFAPPTRWDWSGVAPVSPTPVYLGTDGGINRTGSVGPVNGIGGTMTFDQLNEGIATSLLRGMDIGRGVGTNEVVFAGMQDTGTAGHRRGDAIGAWTAGIDGDGGDVAVDSFNPDIVYGFDGGRFIRSTNGGRTFIDSGFPIPARHQIISIHNENPVRVVTSGHTFRTGDGVFISNVTGGGGIANGGNVVTVLNPREFTLNGKNGTVVAAFGAGPQAAGDRYLTELNITAATLAAPIEIETAVPHGCATGQKVRIDGVAGNVAANNSVATPSWTVTVISPTRLSLNGSDGSAQPAYVVGTGRLRGPAVAGTVPVFRAENTTPIVVTAQGHGFVSGDNVTVTGVTGNLAANVVGQAIRVLDANSFELVGVAGNGVSGAVPRASGQTIGRGLPLGGTNRQRVALVPVAGAVSTTVFVSFDNQLFRSTNGGITFVNVATFTDPISALHAPAANQLWVGIAGSQVPFRAGTVRFSNNAGNSFLGAANNYVNNIGARGPIAAIRSDPAVAAGTTVAVVVAGYSETATERRTRHVFLTTAGGITVGGVAPWHEVGGVFNAPLGNLPDIPVMGLGWERVTGGPSRLLVASDIGVLRLGAASVWERVGPNLPNVSCQALELDNTVDPAVRPQVIRVGTYGRSAWEFEVPAGPSLLVEADLGFGEQQVATTTRRRIVLHSIGSAGVTVTEIFGVAGDFAVQAVPAGPLNFPLALASGEHRAVEVSFTPGAAGDRGTQLIVRSDDPEHSAITLRATGFGIAAGRPRLSVRAFLEFGLVRTGAPGDLPLEIRNLGSAPLTIDTVQLDVAGSNRFSLPGLPALPLVIAPGDATSVTVRFDPNANGVVRGAVIVRGNGQGAVVNLLAEGTTTAAGMVAVLLNTLGLSDPPEVVA